MRLSDYYGKNIGRLNQKKLFLLDMDGTIYLGNKLFDGVNDLLNKIITTGGQFVFVTNNSSRSVDAYLKKLSLIGVKPVGKDNFFTSLQALVMVIEKRHGKPLIYAQGTATFIEELSRSFNVTTDYSETADIIAVGFDTELTFEKMETTCKMLNRGIPYYATNPDWVCPTEYGFVPDCGSMCFGYEKATGRKPVFIGKPEPFMIDVLVEKYGVKKEDVLLIGDRLYTDVKAGENAGVDTVCVLSGESSIEDIETSDVKPTYVLRNIKELLSVYK